MEDIRIVTRTLSSCMAADAAVASSQQSTSKHRCLMQHTVRHNAFDVQSHTSHFNIWYILNIRKSITIWNNEAVQTARHMCCKIKRYFVW